MMQKSPNLTAEPRKPMARIWSIIRKIWKISLQMYFGLSMMWTRWYFTPSIPIVVRYQRKLLDINRLSVADQTGVLHA